MVLNILNILGKQNYSTGDIDPFIRIQGLSVEDEPNYIQDIAISMYPETCYIQIRTEKCPDPDPDIWYIVRCDDPHSIEHLEQNATTTDIINKINQIISYLKLLDGGRS